MELIKQTIHEINTLLSKTEADEQYAESLLKVMDVIKKSKITKKELKNQINPYKYKYVDVKVWAFDNYPQAFIKNRERDNTTYRFSLIYLINENRKKIENITYKSIGYLFGGFDHSTIISAINKVKIWHEMHYPELETFKEIEAKFQQKFK